MDAPAEDIAEYVEPVEVKNVEQLGIRDAINEYCFKAFNQPDFSNLEQSQYVALIEDIINNSKIIGE
jgi:hypothetical protein